MERILKVWKKNDSSNNEKDKILINIRILKTINNITLLFYCENKIYCISCKLLKHKLYFWFIGKGIYTDDN